MQDTKSSVSGDSIQSPDNDTHATDSRSVDKLWPDIKFPPVNLWLLVSALFFYKDKDRNE